MSETSLTRIAQPIGPKIRQLRKARRWTLLELAHRLELSESRLSELERAGGSFSAEQLLRVFQLFQVGAEDFVPHEAGTDPVAGSIQAALVRLGAKHLVADDRFVIRQEHNRPGDLIAHILLAHPTPRFLTALGPVLVEQVDIISFPGVQHAVVQAGAPHRWGWLLDHVLEAISSADGDPAPTPWRRASQRLRTVAEAYLVSLPGPSSNEPYDLIDPDLRSLESVQAAEANASERDARWRVLGRLTVEEFAQPLQVARDTV